MGLAFTRERDFCHADNNGIRNFEHIAACSTRRSSRGWRESIVRADHEESRLARDPRHEPGLLALAAPFRQGHHVGIYSAPEPRFDALQRGEPSV